jgi:hypothetical protein
MKTLTPAQIADEAIGLFIEFRDVHGYPEEEARAHAVLGVAEGAAITDEDLRD